MIASVCLAPYDAQQLVTRFDTDSCVSGLDHLGSIGNLAGIDDVDDGCVDRGCVACVDVCDFGCAAPLSDLGLMDALACACEIRDLDDVRRIADLCHIAPSRGDLNFYRSFVGHLDPNHGVAKPPPSAGIRCKPLRSCCNKNGLLIT